MSTEYVNDVPYVRQFVGELSPTRLRAAAAVNGLRPPPGVEVDYCELGCAHGDTLTALAAAHPRGRFLGVDISAEHIASAKKLARECAVENVGFLERDFADLLHEDVGEFDFIVAHGVLAWISPEKRKALMDFAGAKLKPGGLLYVTYNAMPGWAAVEPLRQLLLSPVGGGADGMSSSLDRARHGVEFAQSMERAGAEYFSKNPAASEMLATMARAGLPYVVHEYLHDYWAPMYSARVAWEMATSDLHFAGVLPLFLNFRDTAIPESLDSIFAAVSDRMTFESLKDFAINEFFRRDLYVKGKVARSADSTNAYLASTPLGTLATAAPEQRSVSLSHRTVKLEGAIFDALFAALAEGAATLPALAERRELVGVSLEKLRAAVLRLLIAERVTPLQSSTRAVATIPDGLFSVPSVFNQVMLGRLTSEAPIVMASAVAGTAFPISRVDALAIRVLTEVVPSKRDEWVTDYVGRHVLRLAVADRVIEDRAEQRRVILDAVEKVRTQSLAKLIELGVLAPSP